MIELDHGPMPQLARLSALFAQYLPGFFQVAKRGPAHFGIFEPEAIQRFHHLGGDDETREPLIVCGNDVPGRFRPAGVADHVLIGRQIFVPELSLLDIPHRELPVFRRLFNALEEALFLFLF